MIIKIQVPLETNIEDPPALIYNQSRSLMEQYPITPEIKEIMGDAPKRYFEAELVGGELRIIGPVPDQPW